MPCDGAGPPVAGKVRVFFASLGDGETLEFDADKLFVDPGRDGAPPASALKKNLAVIAPRESGEWREAIIGPCGRTVCGCGNHAHVHWSGAGSAGSMVEIAELRLKRQYDPSTHAAPGGAWVLARMAEVDGTGVYAKGRVQVEATADERAWEALLCQALGDLSPTAEGREWPDHMLCPIGYELMRDPVVAADGFTYERATIARWLHERGKAACSPMTGAALEHRALKPNTGLRNEIRTQLKLVAAARNAPSAPPAPLDVP